MTFLDASAALAVLLREDDWRDVASAMAAADELIVSPVAIWEMTAGVAFRKNMPVSDARGLVQDFLAAAGVRIVPIGEVEGVVALEALERYGKGRHRAALNMGDCFAYACVRTNGAKLLFKGEDFAATDLAR